MEISLAIIRRNKMRILMIEDALRQYASDDPIRKKLKKDLWEERESLRLRIGQFQEEWGQNDSK